MWIFDTSLLHAMVVITITFSKWSDLTSLLPSKLSRSGFLSDISSKSSRLSGNKQNQPIENANDFQPIFPLFHSFCQKGGKHACAEVGDSWRSKLQSLLMKSPPVPNFAN